MAKSVKSKTNRRLKRSVRRTLGALCMMTAIIVAAIPFPDAAAANDALVSASTSTGYPYEYKLETSDYLTITDTMNQGTKTIDTKTNYHKYEYDENGNLTTNKSAYYDQSKTAYTIYQNSSKVWQMDWQFEYYAEGDNEDGLITQYNGQYAKDVVDLQYQVYADYIYITEADYNKFLSQNTTTPTITVNAYKNINADMDNLKETDTKIKDVEVKSLYYQYIIDEDPTTLDANDTDKLFFQKFFLKEYNQYVSDYQSYLDFESIYASATDEEKKELDKNKVHKPSSLIHTYADVYTTDTERTQFFCNQIFCGTDDAVGTTPMELIGVRLRAASNPDNDTVYIPRLQSEPKSRPVSINGLLYWVDDNLFLADKTNSIAGIAKYAFKGVTNVTTLTMAPEIDFIGDSAFEGSFVKSVTFVKGAKIGNAAFKDCQDLVTVDMTAGVKEIGAEAFSGSAVTDIVVPNTVETIGAGSFYNCKSLQNIIFKNTAKTAIKKFAFFDCPALVTVDFGNSAVTEIGDCAFALAMVPTGNLTDFNFPNSIADGDDIGDYVFGGRTNLKNVVMPINLGTAFESELKDTIFYNCTGLACVEFPETCYNIGYEDDTPNDFDEHSKSTLFKDVKNPEFYVRGPKTNGAGGEAAPRKSTWGCTFGDTTDGATVKAVPYVYTENGKDYYEICDDAGYLSVIDGTGTLISSQFMPDEEQPYDDIGSVENGVGKTFYEIPAYVGTTQVKSIADGCFEGTRGILDYIVALKVEDGSGITAIGDNVFSEAAKLKYVYLGDSVQSIGVSSFAGAPVLERVDIGKSISSIGKSAFENCGNLEYIKFEEPDTINAISIGENAFSTGGSKLTIEGLIDENYGPFQWAMDPSCFMNPEKGVRVLYKSPAPQSMSVILDNKNNMPTLVDYPQIDDLPNDEDISAGIEAGLRDRYISQGDDGQYTVPERNLIDACINVKIPSGIKSIDAAGYFNNTSEPEDGIELNKGLNNEYSIKSYFYDSGALSSKYQDYKDYGLFNADYDEYTDTGVDKNENELEDLGNDRIKSVEMVSVEYLPDNCFYSCENLENVIWSNAMTDVGSLPFENCTKLMTATGSSSFTCANGILYRNNPDGITKTLVECFASRGTENGPGVSTVSLTTDPELLNVTEIEEGAFRNCKELISVDFKNGGTAQFKAIPAECFKGDELLAQAYLPESVTFIGEEAFADTGKSTDVWVYSKNAILGENVYKNVGKPKLTAYEDAPIRQQAKEQDAKIDTSETIPQDGSLNVTFYVRQDGNLIEVGKLTGVQPGANVRKEAPDEIDLAAYIPEGYELSGWEGIGDLTNITTNSIFIAKITAVNTGDSDNPSDDPNNPGGGTGGNTGNGGNSGNSGSGNNGSSGSGNSGSNGSSGSNKDDDDDDDNGSTSDNDSDKDSSKKYTLTVVYGDGSGTYASGSKVIISAIEPPTGKEFYKWTTNNTGVTITSATSAATTVKTTNSDAVVTATYRDKSSVSSNSVDRRPIGNSGTSVQITKPGISNTDKAYASVSGSTDNFIVKITESSAAANAVATALSNEYADMNPIKYFAMDISLYDKNGNQVTNTNGLSVNVTMPIPDALVQYGGNNKVGAVVNGNTLEKLNCKFTTVSGIPCVTFTATHFSPYTIYVDTSNLSVNTLDSTPKTGDGIHPKWFFSLGLGCISILLFMKKDKRPRKAMIS